jgi:TDG/mug DNA glycosylase family protein
MVLPDVLQLGLKVVFCGTAVGDRSAQRGAYYAGPGNRFWEILTETGLTPHRLYPEEYPSLPEFRIGLTDLVKRRSGQDVRLSVGDFDIPRFRAKIAKYAPKAVGFNGKKAAMIFIGTNRIAYGQQRERIGETAIFVLPSTSGAARGYWDPKHWQELAVFIAGNKIVTPRTRTVVEKDTAFKRRQMRIISKRRVLRPSTRMPDSPYRVKAEDVGPADILQLTVSHENNPEKPIGVFEFRGSDIGGKKSIYFTAGKVGESWKLKFVGVSPFTTRLNSD